MPNYGLDPRQRDLEPWGLPTSVLAPGKVITDPVHGDIFLTKLEVAVVDSRPFQRLRRIRQLGNTHLVYPGAVHTRFSHSLGALKVAQLLLDVVWNQSGELHGIGEDLFAEWRRGGGEHADEEWARATILARLGALLHDLCHVPAGHTVEDDLRILVAHDKNEDRFGALWEQVRDDVPARLAELVDPAGGEPTVETLISFEGELHRELRSLIVSKGDSTTRLEEMRYPFCADLVGNTICADLLDYLDRDHLFTGLPESLGRRFISAFYRYELSERRWSTTRSSRRTRCWGRASSAGNGTSGGRQRRGTASWRRSSPGRVSRWRGCPSIGWSSKKTPLATR